MGIRFIMQCLRSDHAPTAAAAAAVVVVVAAIVVYCFAGCFFVGTILWSQWPTAVWIHKTEGWAQALL